MGRYLFPLPVVVVKGSWKKEKVYTRLVPGGEADCDLGRIRLPALKQPVEGAKTLEGAFVTQRGLETILAGGVPESDELYPIGDEGRITSGSSGTGAPGRHRKGCQYAHCY